MADHHSERVADHFASTWQDYDRQIRQSIPFYDDVQATVLRVVRESVDEPRRILDLGVGTGNLAGALLEAVPGAHLTGVDLVPSFLALAGRRLAKYEGRVTLREADVVDFELAPDAYDVIVTSFVFHHLSDEDKRRLYARIHDALAAGGVFLNADFVDSASAYWSAAFDTLRIGHMRDAGCSEDDIRSRYIDHRKLEIPVPMEVQLGWLREAGLEDAECFWKYLNLAVFGARRP